MYHVYKPACPGYSLKTIPYRGLISRGEIFVDWIVKTFCGYSFEVIKLESAISPDKFHYNSFKNFCG